MIDVIQLSGTCKRMQRLLSIDSVWEGRKEILLCEELPKCQAGIKIELRDAYPLFIKYV
jgi:hypothetical protein